MVCLFRNSPDSVTRISAQLLGLSLSLSLSIYTPLQSANNLSLSPAPKPIYNLPLLVPNQTPALFTLTLAFSLIALYSRNPRNQPIPLTLP